MFMIVAIGVYPRPIFEQIQPAVHLVSQNIQYQRERSVEIQKAAAAQEASGPVRATRRGGGPPPSSKSQSSSGTSKTPQKGQ